MIPNSLCLSLFALLDCALNFSSVWIIYSLLSFLLNFFLSLSIIIIIKQLQKLIRISFPAKPDGRILCSICHLATSVAIYSHAPFNFYIKISSEKIKNFHIKWILTFSCLKKKKKLNLENKTARFPWNDRQ